MDKEWSVLQRFLNAYTRSSGTDLCLTGTIYHCTKRSSGAKLIVRLKKIELQVF